MRRLATGSLTPLVLVACLALLLSGCGPNAQKSGAASQGTLFGPFAGYVWTGHVRQVSATVIVPGVIALSQQGTAGTWIGAQGPMDSKTLVSPFFQVGVNEVRLRARNGVPGQVGYYGFWSSTGRGFHPVPLFEVYPGDSVRLVMTLTDGDWRISADDLTQRYAKTFLVASPEGASYDQAIWLQEDVSNNAGAQLPYPEVSPPAFRRLKVDRLTPRVGSLSTSWMSTRVGVFGPSPLRSDGFLVRKVHPSAAALRYEEISDAEYLPAGVFDDDAALWTTHTPQTKIAAACLQFADVLQHTVTSFRSYRWPATVQGRVRQLSDAIAASRLALMKLSRTPLSRQRQVAAAFKRPAVETDRLGAQIRHQLQVPVVDPSGLIAVDYLQAHAA